MSCTKCEGMTEIRTEIFTMFLEEDVLTVRVDFGWGFPKDKMKLQISYCPFCGRDLHGEINKYAVGQRIKAIRLDKKMTMKELGNLLKIGSGGVNNWEKGVNLPNAKRIAVIAKLGNVTTDELLGIKKD